jgi:hypothetical protein
MSELLQAALQLAEAGYAVLPLRPGEKIPLLPGGYKGASTEPKLIREWWSRQPNANIGISTSRLIVIDLDAPDGLDWPDGPLNRELQDRAGAVARSPRGGLHLYYASPELLGVRCSTGKLGKGVDVRACGGHITAPPSRTAAGSYAWLRELPPRAELPEPPVWLLERLAALERPAPVSAAVNGSINGHAPAALAEAVEIIPQGRRKSTLVSLAGKLRDRGVSLDAIRAAVETENRLRCRPPLPDAELADILRSASKWRPGDLPTQRELKPVRASEIAPESVRWLWPSRVPIGGITLLVGRPGAGKGIFCADLASRVSRAAAAPDGEQIEPGDVLIISAEDHRSAVIRPRLDAAEADCTRVHILSETFDIGDYSALESLCERIGDQLRLVIVDPAGSFMPAQRDFYRDNEVRATLSPLAALAAERGFAALVVAHTRTADAVYADDLALGSRAFVGIARSVQHLLEESVENKPTGRRLLLPGKINLARRPAGLAFRIWGDPPRAEWEAEPLPEWFTADMAIGRKSESGGEKKAGRPPDQLEEAIELLRVLLAQGECPAKAIRKAAEDGGISRRTLLRAKSELGIKHRFDPEKGAWFWFFEQTEPADQSSDLFETQDQGG